MSKSKVFGYARVSSKDQNLDRQIQQLLEYGINEDCIFADKCSGKDFDRFEYKTLLNRLRDEDLVVICSIDRLGRNYSEIVQQWDYITNTIQANIKVLDMPLLDTTLQARIVTILIRNLYLTWYCRYSLMWLKKNV